MAVFSQLFGVSHDFCWLTEYYTALTALADQLVGEHFVNLRRFMRHQYRPGIKRVSNFTSGDPVHFDPELQWITICDGIREKNVAAAWCCSSTTVYLMKHLTNR